MLKKFNKEYFNLWKEIPLFLILFFSLKTQKDQNYKNRILIVNTCLIGEFISSLYALHAFILKNNDCEIDLLVAPNLKSLAQKIKGVSFVYTARPIVKRNSVYENYQEMENEYLNEIYDEVVVLRISGSAYNFLRKIKTRKIKINLVKYFNYAVHLTLCLIYGKEPKQWREINFEMLEILDSEKKYFLYKDIFDQSYFKNILEIDNFKKIVIHTGANWAMKNWPCEKWVELIERINNFGSFNFVFVGSKEDENNFDCIYGDLKNKKVKITNLINKTKIEDLFVIFSQSNYFIGIDGGPSNMAFMSGIPSVVLYGVSPNMYLPISQNDIALYKGSKRNFWDMFWYRKNSPINNISVSDVCNAFLKIK